MVEGSPHAEINIITSSIGLGPPKSAEESESTGTDGPVAFRFVPAGPA
jgi:hypothetical protein